MMICSWEEDGMVDKGNFEFGPEKDFDFRQSFCYCMDHYNYNSCYTIDNFSDEYSIDNCSNSGH